MLLLFSASEVHHFSGVAGSWAGGCGGGCGGGGEGEEGGWKSGWDCRKVESDSGDFPRSIGDRSVGKVLQLKRWVVVCLEVKQCGQRGEEEASIL